MRRVALKIVSVLMIVVLLTGCSSGILKGMKSAGDNIYVTRDSKYEKLAKLASDSARELGFRGTMIIATDEDIIMYCGQGSTDVNGKPVGPTTTYEIGSVSKMITATMTLMLIDQGKLSMDDKITKFFPEYVQAEDVTVADLLHMQSGIPEYVNSKLYFFDKEDYTTMFENDTMTDEIFLRCLYKHDLKFEPKTNTEYSNTNFHLLAMIIEQVEGESFGDVLKREIFDPCGMKHTSAMTVGDVTSVPGPLGYQAFQKGSRGAGDIHSCAEDMIAFDRALFGGKLLSEGSLKLMTDFRGTFYGCGMKYINENAYGHSGSTPAYISQSVIIETEEYGRVYFFASATNYEGIQGFEVTMNAVIEELS